MMLSVLRSSRCVFDYVVVVCGVVAFGVCGCAIAVVDYLYDVVGVVVVVATNVHVGFEVVVVGAVDVVDYGFVVVGFTDVNNVRGARVDVVVGIVVVVYIVVGSVSVGFDDVDVGVDVVGVRWLTALLF